jgi:hypothetical protein
MGAFEAALHLTGAYDEYAPWWEGKRFTSPIRMWAAGDTVRGGNPRCGLGPLGLIRGALFTSFGL